MQRYSVILEPTQEPENPGWYYAHIPALVLTTHGLGIDGALAAEKDLIEGWVAELKATGKASTHEKKHPYVTSVEVVDRCPTPQVK